jgi:hypothetical protein
MKTALFWGMMPCSLVDCKVSEEPVASVFSLREYAECGENGMDMGAERTGT